MIGRPEVRRAGRLASRVRADNHRQARTADAGLRIWWTRAAKVRQSSAGADLLRKGISSGNHHESAQIAICRSCWVEARGSGSSKTQIWVQFGSNLGPIRISIDCFPFRSALFGLAKLLKIRLLAISQRGGQRFDPAQLHQVNQEDNLKVWSNKKRNAAWVQNRSTTLRSPASPKTSYATFSRGSRFSFPTCERMSQASSLLGSAA
jgi:hypothetical protein